MTIRLVPPVAAPAPKPKIKTTRKPRTRAFKYPLLTEMSPDEQRAYVEHAHDAILAARLPTYPDLTVKEALLLYPQLKLAERAEGYQHTPGALWSGWLERDLEVLGVQLSPPRDRLLAPLEAAVLAGYEVDDSEFGLAMRAGRFDLPAMHVIGVTERPIGYAVCPDKPSNSAQRASQKPILHFYDVVPLQWGLPLYHEPYKHLIDMTEVLERHQPWQALKEREAAEKRATKAAVAQLAEDAPAAALARSFKLIMSARLEFSFTVREAIRSAQHTAEEDSRPFDKRMVAWQVRTHYATALAKAGILMRQDGSADVVAPDKLVQVPELRVLSDIAEQLQGLRLLA